MKQFTTQEFENELRNRGYFFSLWCLDDIKTLAKDAEIELTDDQIDNIAESIYREHDATVGINWDVIDYHIKREINS